MTTFLQSLRLLLTLGALTGVLYPLAVTAVARLAFRDAATGSIARLHGRPVGSLLIAQRTTGSGHFWPRPSAGDHSTIPGAASNLGPTSAELARAIAARRAVLGASAPDELLTSSASGLDPHLSPAAAKFQAARVAASRNLPKARVEALVDRLAERPQLGFLGEKRVNVLSLNLALDGGE